MESNTASTALQKALLDSVSHNLRAPLASITGVLDSLIEDRGLLDDATEQELLRSARDEAKRLNKLIANLLEITRLDGGAVHLNIEPCDLDEVIGAALLQLHSKPGGPLVIDIPQDLPLIPMDFALITQSLVNVIENAFKYAKPGQPTEIKAVCDGCSVRIVVADRGKGIPPQDLDRIFDKFYSGSSGNGIGLGLSICRGFVEAHGGSIRAENREGGGSAITITLPLAKP